MPAIPKLPSFQSLPIRARVALVAAGLALLAAGGYMFLVAPKNREATTLKVRLAREDPDALPAPPAYPPITEEERKLWVQLEARLRQRYPAEKDLPGALKAVAEAARAARMELVSISLQPPPPPKPGTRPSDGGPGSAAPPPLKVAPPLAVNATAIKLTALNRYGDLVQFLEGLDRLPVAVVVETVEVKRLKNRLRTDITLRALRWGTS